MMDKNVKLVFSMIVIILGIIVVYRWIGASKDEVKIIYVPESFGPIVAIARRPTSITIAFESGDILIVNLGPIYGSRHFKVVWEAS